MNTHRARLVGTVSVLVAVLAMLSPNSASAGVGVPYPTDDPFYSYTGAKPLADYAPGEILKSRTTTVTLPDLPAPVTMTQILYRTRDQLGKPVATVTSVLNPPTPAPTVRLLSYQSFYDALTVRCEPSYMLSGGPTNSLWTSEVKMVEALLTQGFTMAISDFESQNPAFGTGPVYGYESLDGIRAAYNSTDVALPSGTKVGMVGYSGGAIATEWASELAPTYAPDVAANLVASAFGGVFVHPMHNLHYVDGSDSWSGVMPLALIGIGKAFKLDFTPYLSDKGKTVLNLVKNDCIGEHPLPNLTFASLVKPQYAKAESIPIFVDTANALIMGSHGLPKTSVPMLIREGSDVQQGEGTAPSPTYGPGDGVMLVNDVRSLVHKYCDAGISIDYAESPLGHSDQGAAFLAEAGPWMAAQFAGTPAVSTCATVQPGNSLAPTSREKPAVICHGLVATIVGTPRANRIHGTPGRDVIAAGGGNDTITGAGGNDVICAGRGNDVVNGGSGNDWIQGGPGADTLRGNAGNDVLRARDREVDHAISGGRGRDRALIDRRDPRPTSASYQRG